MRANHMINNLVLDIKDLLTLVKKCAKQGGCHAIVSHSVVVSRKVVLAVFAPCPSSTPALRSIDSLLLLRSRLPHPQEEAAEAD